MAGRKLTIEDFPLKTEGTDRCWIKGCEKEQRTSGLCRTHYDSARYCGVLKPLVMQIDTRSEALPPLEAELRALKEALTEAVGAHPEPLTPLQQVALLQRRAERGGASALAVLKIWAAGMHADLVDIPTDPDDARAWAEQEWAKEEGYRRQREHLLQQQLDRSASRDGQYLRALLDVLEVRYDDPRPSDDADGGLTQLARNVLRSWALRHAEAVADEHCAILKVWAEAINVGLGDAPEGEQEAAAWAKQQWEEYEKWWKGREDRLIEAAKNKDAELSSALGSVRRLADELTAVESSALGSVRRLADELTAVDAALGPYLQQVAGNRCAAIRYVCCNADQITAVDAALGPTRLADAGGNRILAIEVLTAPSGEVLLSEANLRERFFRLNEIGHAESLLTGLSEPLQKALRAVLEEQKFQVLRVCPWS